MAVRTPVLGSILAAMASHNPWLVAITIFSATLVHEDIATIAAGIVVADGLVGAEIALPAFYRVRFACHDHLDQRAVLSVLFIWNADHAVARLLAMARDHSRAWHADIPDSALRALRKTVRGGRFGG